MHEQAFVGRRAGIDYQPPVSGKSRRAGYLSPAGQRALKVGLDLAVVALACGWAVYVLVALAARHA